MRVTTFPIEENMAMESERKRIVPKMRQTRVDLYSLLSILLLLTIRERNLFLGLRGVTRSLSSFVVYCYYFI